jgi:vesicle coat complex subunit
LTFFPAVLKTLSTPFPSTRPLVYNYLVHHAEADPDTALLSINTIQKSLSDSNPRIRAMALKTMSGIRIPMISQIVSLTIKKGTSDLSPLVRKAAALACVKCVKLDPSTRPQVEEQLAILLADKQYYVAGAAIQAFAELCPDRLDLIHPVYRSLCKMAVDMDEWGQLSLIKLLTNYSRKCFPQRTKRVKRAATQAQRAAEFYEDLEPQEENPSDYEEVDSIDPDLDLFLKSILPLLSSRNSAVIVSVTRAYLYLSPTIHLPLAIGPLIALLRSPLDIQQIALHDILQVCLHSPQLFVPYTRHFLLHTHEPPHIQTLKLELLTLIFPHTTSQQQNLLLAEIEHFSLISSNPTLTRASVRALGRCAQASSPSTSRRCLTLLLKQIHSADQHLVGEAIEVIRHLIQRDPAAHQKTLIRLAKNLDTLTSPTARASIVWLVGEFDAGLDSAKSIAADVLRILIKGYADETDEVREQVVLLGAKVYLHHLNAENAKRSSDDSHPAESSQDTHPIKLLYAHLLTLSRYTPSFALRSRTRFLSALLSNPTSTDLASLLLLAPKPIPKFPSAGQKRKDLGFVVGTSGLVVGENVQGRWVIDEWVAEGMEPVGVRDEDLGDGYGRDEMGRGEAVAAGSKLDEVLRRDGGPKKVVSLERWLDSSEEEESESEEEESGETESEEDEDDEDEDEEEETESEEESESEEEDERAGLVK